MKVLVEIPDPIMDLVTRVYKTPERISEYLQDTLTNSIGGDIDGLYLFEDLLRETGAVDLEELQRYIPEDLRKKKEESG